MSALWQPCWLDASPMFEPLRPAARGLEKLSDWPRLDDYTRLLAARPDPVRTRSGLPIAFVPQGPKPRDLADEYEPRIYLKGEVQTRTGNWHDLFNALVWLTFPGTKAVLNEMHWVALQKECSRADKKRSPARDVATQFDESGVIIACADPELAALFMDFEWQELFWEMRARVTTCMKFYLFGHGLYEKALHPFVGMTGKGIILMAERTIFDLAPDDQVKTLDAMAVARLEEPGGMASARDLPPVPVLGYPGWAKDNGSQSYYGNTRYFRPGRIR